MMNYLIVFLISLAICDSKLLERYREIYIESELGFLISDILEKLYGKSNCVSILSDGYYNGAVVDLFVKSITKPVYKIYVKENEDLLSPNYETMSVINEIKKNECGIYVILLTNPEQLSRLLLFGDKHRAIDTRAIFVLMHDKRLFLPKYHFLWKKIINVIFVKRFRGTSRFELSTIPFPASIKFIGPVSIDTWKNGKFQKNRELITDKTSNLKQQTLKVVTFEHIPTTTKSIEKSMIFNGTHFIDKDFVHYGGLEVEVLRTLAKAMNFKPVIYESLNADKEQWGMIQTNGSYSGLLGEISNGVADIVLANLYYTPYHLQIIDLTQPYTTQCLTFLTPESLTDNSWQTLILPFQMSMWISVLITLLIGGFIFFILANFHRYIEKKDFKKGDSKFKIYYRKCSNLIKKLLVKKKKNFQIEHKNDKPRESIILTNIKRRLKSIFDDDVELIPSRGLHIFDNFVNSILYTYGMLLAVSLPKIPNTWSIRVLTACWLVYCILVAVSYRASLTAILAKPAPRVTIDTLEELSDSEIQCGGWGEQWKDFFITSLDKASQKVGRKFEVVYDVEKSIERVSMGQFAYYENIYFLQNKKIERNVRNLQTNRNESKKGIETGGRLLHIMSDCVINMPISIGVQKNSPLKHQIDKFLTKIIEAGLVKKWLTDVVFSTRAVEARTNEEEIKALMNLSKLYGAFVALFFGYLLSIFCLFVELFIWYCITVKDPRFDEYNLPAYYAKNKK